MAVMMANYLQGINIVSVVSKGDYRLVCCSVYFIEYNCLGSNKTTHFNSTFHSFFFFNISKDFTCDLLLLSTFILLKKCFLLLPNTLYIDIKAELQNNRILLCIKHTESEIISQCHSL